MHRRLRYVAYVSSYPTKMKNDHIVEALYGADIDARNAAFRYVTCLHPTKPEMWFMMSRPPSSHLPGWHKKFAVPRLSNVIIIII